MNRPGQNDFLRFGRTFNSGVNAAFVAKMRSIRSGPKLSGEGHGLVAGGALTAC
jgi:hypothetical protein